ncbi:MAG: EamA/RhaT family transporter [Lachnospiraceae bacterium]|jgi:undecaprenyl phosphate-alpha-L-ara4N flippase subunit ArnE|nr:EamA/RhaT family transporter [Lachnospiraceae bacterium]MBR4277655.1 EamA/RhaT family transporter [Lachnospiraceae bacterium]MBR6302743.1 EamA/RhaT family transporter [Lachnospiraceae bacterium]MBR6908722.1 EamA/RhaT family transporter [Lachnospiraceae bacterium]
MIESLKKNGKGIILLLISAFSLALGQLLWKKPLENVDIPLVLASGFSGIWSLFLKVLPGFIVYAIGAVVMTIGLGYGELSVLQPINSMSYVFALILSAIFVPTESISVITVIGVFVVIAGVIVIGGSSKK